MKKQLIATMAVVMGLAGSMATPVQASGLYRVNNKLQSKGCVIINGKLCDVSDIKDSLDEWCQQIQSGSGNNCSVILLPGCNQPSKPENNQPEVEQPEQENPDSNLPEVEQPELPDNNQPEQDNSGNNTPDVEMPDINKPDNNQPEQEIPDNNQSGDNSSQPEVDNNQPEQETPDVDNLSYAEQVVELVNVERAKAGLLPVELDTEIASAAWIRANEIKTLFSHTRPDGRSFSSVLTDNGIRFYGAGENIAWGQRTPEQVMNAWMNSDGHRANILNSKYTKLGVGHFQDASGTNYWVQLFTY